MAIKCEFSYVKDLYTCKVLENQAISKEIKAENLEGEHLDEKSLKEVENLMMMPQTVPSIPQLGDIFPHLKVLEIHGSIASVSKYDLQQFSHLENLELIATDIEFLPGDLFEFSRGLKSVFISNSLKFIGTELLDGLNELESLTLTGENFNYVYEKNFDRLEDLEEIKEEIRERFKPQVAAMNKSESWMSAKKIWSYLNPTNLTASQNTKKLHEDVENFLTNEDFKDFTVKVGTAEFKVHKFVIAARSATMAEMIKNNLKADEIILEDISAETFKAVLDYIYADQPPTTNAGKVFEAAHKLKIDGLKNVSAEVLLTEMEDGDSFEGLMENFNLGAKFKEEKVKLKALEEMRKFYPTEDPLDMWSKV